MKKALVYFSLALATIMLASCAGNSKKASEQQEDQSVEQADSLTIEKAELTEPAVEIPEEPVFDIVTNYGTIRVKLYKDTPKHRDNFVKLAMGGFFNGTLFHRVINNFMIQGGDPLTKDPQMASAYGTGGPGYTIPAEILPQYYHKKGALAAARRGDAANPLKESSGSQFYIVQNEENCFQLDGEYTIFGETIDGIKTVDKIAAVQTDLRDRPVEDVTIISINFVPEN